MHVKSRLAVLTATVVVVLAACGPADDGDPTPAPSTPTSTATKPAVLTITGLDVGAPPKIAWSNGSLLNGNPDKDVLPANLNQFAETKQLLVMRDIDGDVFAYSPDGPKGTTPIGKATGNLAINKERNLVAWVAPDGSPTVLQEGEAKPAILPNQAGVTTSDAVAVLGHDCFNGPETVEGAGCSVLFRSTGSETPMSYASSNHGFVEALSDKMLAIQDADKDGSIGWNRLNENQATCSTSIGSRPWTTCDHLPLSFSPDGRHILATQPEGFEGAGAGEIAFLDRNTGKPLMAVRNSAASQVFVTAMVWEDRDHVLATVNDGRNEAIIRVGLDGRMEFAVEPVRLDETAANPYPLRLGLQP